MKYLQRVCALLWGSWFLCANVYAQTDRNELLEKYFDWVRSVAVKEIPGEKFQFDSVSPTDPAQLLNKQGAPAVVDAYVEYPENTSGPVPAVVLLNCGDTLKEFKEIKYAKAFRKAGYATIIVNSFANRQSALNEQSKFVQFRFAAAADAFLALAWIAKNPRIDAKRVALVAWGNSGAVATMMSAELIREAYLGKDLRYVAAIGISPQCSFSMIGRAYNTTPVLLLLGERDEQNSPQACNRLGQELRNTGAEISIKTYPGAFHQWDMPGPARYFAQIPTAKTCWATVDARNMTIQIGADTVPIGSSEIRPKLDKHLKECFGTGAQWGNVGGTSRLVMDDVMSFLSQKL